MLMYLYQFNQVQFKYKKSVKFSMTGTHGQTLSY